MERSEKSERSSFFIPKGALTHHLTVGQIVALPVEVVRSFSGGQQITTNPCLSALVGTYAFVADN